MATLRNLRETDAHRHGLFEISFAVWVLLATSAFAADPSVADSQSGPLTGRVTARVRIPYKPERLSSLTAAKNGDAVIGVATWKHRGRILRVSRKPPYLAGREVPDAIETVTVTDDGRTCYLQRDIVCFRNAGAETRVRPAGAVIDRLYHSGGHVYALDRSAGSFFRVGLSSVQRIPTPFPITAVAIGPDGAALVGAQDICWLSNAESTPNHCSHARGMGAFGPADDAASTASFAVVIHLPEREAVLVARNGSVMHVALPMRVQRADVRDRGSVWIAGADDGGSLAVADISSRGARMLRVNARLSGGAMIAGAGPDSLVLLDADARTALFVTIRR
ncbi:MAG: hypothetical protein QOJ39_3733 [Candidatus Eremiobacteraeota bacterium]|nr:hypothetical protein [Candidatus Eremiobacteraeota bacterium]